MSLYQNLGEPLITIAIFLFLEANVVFLTLKTLQIAIQVIFSIVLTYFIGFTAQLNFSLQSGPLNEKVGQSDIPGLEVDTLSSQRPTCVSPVVTTIFLSTIDSIKVS